MMSKRSGPQIVSSLRTSQLNVPADVIDLGIGQPGFDLLPLDIVRRAAQIRLSGEDTSFLNYGYEQGDGYFRVALARFLQAQYGIPVSGDTLMTTAGASQALDMICTHFAREGDTVFVEEPTYFLALRIFADRRLKVVGLPTDEEGLVVEAVEEALARQRPAFLYTVPTFQNPAGATLPAERRKRLADLAREGDFFVVADEVYHMLNYTGAPPAPMAMFVEGERVLSIGSFSKILAPGLRLGWIQAAPSLLQRFVQSGLLDSGGGLNPFTSSLVRVILERGWQEAHLEHLREVYGRRVPLMEAALQRHLGRRARYRTPDGGYYFWVSLPEAVDTAELLEEAKGQRVRFQPGVKFSSRHERHNAMRLSFAFYDEKGIEAGVERLGRVVDDAAGHS